MRISICTRFASTISTSFSFTTITTNTFSSIIRIKTRFTNYTSSRRYLGVWFSIFTNCCFPACWCIFTYITIIIYHITFKTFFSRICLRISICTRFAITISTSFSFTTIATNAFSSIIRIKTRFTNYTFSRRCIGVWFSIFTNCCFPVFWCIFTYITIIIYNFTFNTFFIFRVKIISITTCIACICIFTYFATINTLNTRYSICRYLTFSTCLTARFVSVKFKIYTNIR